VAKAQSRFLNSPLPLVGPSQWAPFFAFAVRTDFRGFLLLFPRPERADNFGQTIALFSLSQQTLFAPPFFSLPHPLQSSARLCSRDRRTLYRERELEKAFDFPVPMSFWCLGVWSIEPRCSLKTLPSRGLPQSPFPLYICQRK